MAMKFDWKDAAILLAVFVSINLVAGYVQTEINPFKWPTGVREDVVGIYMLTGWLPSILRRMP